MSHSTIVAVAVRTSLVSLAAAACLTLVACAETDPVVDDEATQGDAGSGPGDTPSAVRFEQTECVQCTQEKCETELHACEGDVECTELWTCVGACPVAPEGNAPEDGCAQACGHSEADNATFGAVGECVAQQCAATCN